MISFDNFKIESGESEVDESDIVKYVRGDFVQFRHKGQVHSGKFVKYADEKAIVTLLGKEIEIDERDLFASFEKFTFENFKALRESKLDTPSERDVAYKWWYEKSEGVRKSLCDKWRKEYKKTDGGLAIQIYHLEQLS